ncbi:hypothetical protein HN681_04385 [archaeon]|jgi:hypothetical protein|nr:hypothetical protein [archaeon]MBT3730642.1 hypothetical protein [archaeon]MBT4669544.1 hypothetical protein [archaeon]MBT5030301.1 hypothetical protein [archaeon]MBT5288406.1 hypothetical protein [archaeon]
MLIATDWDDVGVECFRPFVEYVNGINGNAVRYEDLDSYYEMDKAFGVKQEELQDVFLDFFSGELLKKVKAVEGSRELYEGLRKKGHELVVVTSRSVIETDPTLDQIERLHPGLISNAYFADLPFIDRGRGSKKDICKALGVDVLIEDSYENLDSCLAHIQRGFLLKRPWNQNIVGLPKKVTRVEDPREILKYF